MKNNPEAASLYAKLPEEGTEGTVPVVLDLPAPTAAERGEHVALTVLRRAGLIGLWAVQYVLVVPMVAMFWFVWRAMVLFGWAFILLFIPIIGWVVLALIWQSRQADRRSRNVIAAVNPEMAVALEPGPSVLARSVRPWFGGAW